MNFIVLFILLITIVALIWFVIFRKNDRLMKIINNQVYDIYMDKEINQIRIANAKEFVYNKIENEQIDQKRGNQLITRLDSLHNQNLHINEEYSKIQEISNTIKDVMKEADPTIVVEKEETTEVQHISYPIIELKIREMDAIIEQYESLLKNGKDDLSKYKLNEDPLLNYTKGLNDYVLTVKNIPQEYLNRLTNKNNTLLKKQKEYKKMNDTISNVFRLLLNCESYIKKSEFSSTDYFIAYSELLEYDKKLYDNSYLENKNILELERRIENIKQFKPFVSFRELMKNGHTIEDLQSDCIEELCSEGVYNKADYKIWLARTAPDKWEHLGTDSPLYKYMYAKFSDNHQPILQCLGHNYVPTGPTCETKSRSGKGERKFTRNKK